MYIYTQIIDIGSETLVPEYVFCWTGWDVKYGFTLSSSRYEERGGLLTRVWSPAVPVQGSPRLIILYEPPQLVLSVWTPRLLLFPLLFLFLSPPPTLLIFLSFFQRRVDQDEKYKYDPENWIFMTRWVKYSVMKLILCSKYFSYIWEEQIKYNQTQSAKSILANHWQIWIFLQSLTRAFESS